MSSTTKADKKHRRGVAVVRVSPMVLVIAAALYHRDNFFCLRVYKHLAMRIMFVICKNVVYGLISDLAREPDV